MATVFIDDWLINLPASDYRPHVEEVNALEDFLSGFISPQSAAETFTMATTSTKDNIEKGLYRLWRILLAIGRKFPDTQSELVQLMEAIKALPELKSDGEVVTVGELKVWTDLPLFGSEIRNYWISKLSSPVQITCPGHRFEESTRLFYFDRRCSLNSLVISGTIQKLTIRT